MIYIVGAGPAGLSTGLFLIEKGFDVTILEKEKRIKSTPCGEGCDVSSLSLLPFDSTPYIERYVEGVKFLFGERYFYFKIKGVVLNRQKWLEGMAEEFVKRGGKIKFSTKVERIDDDYIYTPEEKIKYSICIGADGPLSAVRKYVGNGCHVEVGSEYEIEYEMADNFLHFYISKKYSKHYAWIFPKKNSINVGIIGKFSKLDLFLKDIGIKGRIISKKAGIIPYGGTKKFVKNNVAIVGDAACMANPFSLGGITPAIYAAKILSTDITSLEKYEEKIKKHEIMNPIFIKGKRAIEKLKDEETKIAFRNINGKEFREIKYRDMLHLMAHPFTLLKMYYIGKALEHSMKYGW